MSSIDLSKCDQICHNCIKGYIKKYNLKKGDEFTIPCKGIPLKYLPDSVLSSLGQADPEMAIAMLDPIVWARKMLDWHCIDPKGEVWKQKTEEASLPTGVPPFDPILAAKGRSFFHRPYQKSMLQCTSKRKVFRTGRQIGKSVVLSIACLHALYTNENFKIVLIAPYQTQVDLVFSNINQFIASNSILSNSVKRNVKAPNYTIELHNGSKISGFTAGTRSGGNADAVRGQTANMLVFDEADYLNSSDVDSALAIITNFPDATVWMSSTPTGRRERFYKICHSKQFREFHYPSNINPAWTEELDSLYKDQLTKLGYQHEILGSFGDQEEGVYQAKYVEAAQSDYKYGELLPTKGWIYTIGVDWNDYKIGTTIAVIGHNPIDEKFYLVDTHVVTKSENTQLHACHKIAEYNRLWRPFSIYVDDGYGSVQVSILRKFGQDSISRTGPNSPDAKLRDIVKGYKFGGIVEIRDLFTKQTIKKPAKPFLVENSVRRFEQCSFKYPITDIKLTAAFQGYIVNRITPSGQPVYEQRDESAGDHMLDAVNLALVAFSLEKSEFGKATYDTTVRFNESFNSIVRGMPSQTSTKDTFQDRAKVLKPETNRSNLFTNSKLLPVPNDELPASNMKVESNMKLWSWPGFGQDSPKPQTRSKEKAFREAQKKIFGRGLRGTRPSRKKF